MCSKRHLRSTNSSGPGEWLIGEYHKELTINKLPSRREVLSLFLFHHYENKLTISDSLKLTTQKIQECWEPTISIKDFHVKEKIKRLFNTWQKLKKNRLRVTEVQRNNEKMFLSLLDNMFECTLQREKNNLSTKFLTHSKKNLSLKNSEPPILLSQKSNVSGCSVSSHEIYPSPPKRRKTSKSCKENIITPELSSMLDRSKTSNRSATFIIAATTASLKKDLTTVSVSKDTIRRTRQKHREDAIKYIKESFKPDTCLTVHWDSKLMRTSKSFEAEDRLAILVTGEGVSKLLAIPIISGSSGINQATAIFETLLKWDIADRVRSLSFDTTASNTGIHEGATIHLETMLQKNMLHFACRHHILELILTATFSSQLESVTSGPQITLFERFKKEWPKLDKKKFEAGNIEDHTEIKEFILNQLKNQHPRDDYKEVLTLSLIYLGEPTTFVINKPGAYHRARWMSKIIYCLKIYLFRSQFNISKKVLKELEKFNTFVITIYLKAWFLCQIPMIAPRIDLQLLKDLVQFKEQNRMLGSAALNSFSRHLWYLSDYLIGLAFFDDDISIETKIKMVSALKTQSRHQPLNRIQVKECDIMNKEIHYFVNQNTRYFFEALNLSDDFLQTHPATWNSNQSYLRSLKTVSSLHIVNDTAERGVALMQEYLQFVKNEDELQRLLQVVEENRKLYPNVNKINLIRTLNK